MENKPEYGKVYSLTGGSGQPSIASGNTWAESEVKEINWGQESINALNAHLSSLPHDPKEIMRKEQEMNEYWDELRKHDPTSYSYPFHQAKRVEEMKKENARYIENRKELNQ